MNRSGAFNEKNMRHLQIADRGIGEGNSAFIVGEVGMSHEGSLGIAHAYIDAIAKTGADAVKFQTHIAAEESTRDEPFRVQFSMQDASRYDYWKRMEFTEEQWRGLMQHAEQKGLLFLSSPFSIAAMEMLLRVGVPAWKVGSGEAHAVEMLRAMASTGLPMLLSTGMSTTEEVDRQVQFLRQKAVPFALLQCASRYPTPFEEVGLNVIEELRCKYQCPTGLSDHSGTIFPGLAAMATGADILEVHVVIDRGMFGPDVGSSVTMSELQLLSSARDAFDIMRRNPVEKTAAAHRLSDVKALFTKSLAPTRPLKAGTVLERSMLTAKKPGTGIPCDRLDALVGRRLLRDVAPDRLLTKDDFDAET